MLTKEQLENAARFMGISIEEDGVDINGLPWYWSPELDKHWNPEFDWRDFGPLWVRLERWERLQPTRCTATYMDNVLRPLLDAYTDKKLFGTDRDIMQAGCLLGAAIQKAKGKSR